jgi:hypothetical protein
MLDGGLHAAVTPDRHHPRPDIRARRVAPGAFVAALSAVDEEGKEGGYYLWTCDELKDVLSVQEYELAVLAWRFGSYPTTQGGYLPIETLSPTLIAQRTPLVAKLLEVIQELADNVQRQEEEIGRLKDEIAVLKKQNKRPKIKPSKMDDNTASPSGTTSKTVFLGQTPFCRWRNIFDGPQPPKASYLGNMRSY